MALFIFTTVEVSLALPPPEEIPEEVLRTQIILEARSPLNGEPMSAAEYAQLQASLAQAAFPPDIDPQLEHLIFLTRLRKLLRTIIPFF